MGLISLAGVLLLLTAVVLEYRLSFSDFSSELAIRYATQEMLEHVALPMLVLMAPMTIAGLWVIRQAFKPLKDAAAEIEAAHGHERGFRIDTSNMPAEVMPFTDAVNRLLERIDDAAARQEAFAADVAHELRTPLAVLSLELDRLDRPDATRLKADVAAMRRLIDQLMLLAQVDPAVAVQMPSESVKLGEVAADVVGLLAPGLIAERKTIALETSDASPVVRGRREAIAAAIRNLAENAARVTPPGGAVRVHVGPGAQVRVQDEGPGLSADRLSELVQRHKRADHASKHGAGLGLAIVDRIMAAHGGSLTTDPAARELRLSFRESN